MGSEISMELLAKVAEDEQENSLNEGEFIALFIIDDKMQSCKSIFALLNEKLLVNVT